MSVDPVFFSLSSSALSRVGHCPETEVTFFGVLDAAARFYVYMAHLYDIPHTKITQVHQARSPMCRVQFEGLLEALGIQMATVFPMIKLARPDSSAFALRP